MKDEITIPSWLIDMLLSLLEQFLTDLFNKWLNPKPAGLKLGGVDFLTPSKTDFVNSLRWKFWYGPQRMQLGGQLYDKAVARYNSPDFAQYMSSTPEDPKVYAHMLCNGLQP